MSEFQINCGSESYSLQRYELLELKRIGGGQLYCDFSDLNHNGQPSLFFNYICEKSFKTDNQTLCFQLLAKKRKKLPRILLILLCNFLIALSAFSPENGKFLEILSRYRWVHFRSWNWPSKLWATAFHNPRCRHWHTSTLSWIGRNCSPFCVILVNKLYILLMNIMGCYIDENILPVQKLKIDNTW